MRLLESPGEVERQLGRVISLAGVPLLLVLALRIPQGGSEPPLWQQVGGLALAAIILLNAVGGRRFPLALLAGLWIAFPAILGVMGLASFAPTGAPIPEDHRPWPWGMEAAAFSYVALVVRRAFEVLLYPLIIGLTPLLSAWVFGVPLDEMPRQFAADIPMLVSTVGFAVIILVFRARLLRFERSRENLRRAEEHRTRSVAEAERRRDFSLIVHDHVLSVLSAGMLHPELESEDLRTGARAALEVLVGPELLHDAGPVEENESTKHLCGEWELAWLRIDPYCLVVVHDLGGDVPADVAIAVEAATAEALRNSVRHAGEHAFRAVVARLGGDEIEIRVSDDGPGFDVEAIAPERMGVRAGIIERVERIGGTVSFSSEDGARTQTRIAWARRD